MARILIAGDTCPIGRNEPLFRIGNAQALLGELFDEFAAADLRIVNLECPLVEHEQPVAKCGPHLAAPTDCANGLRAMEIDVVGVANNHIMDHGPAGLRTTLQALDRAGIAHVGAGADLDQSRSMLIRLVQGSRVGIIAMAEHEFGMATTRSPGANPLNVIAAVREIERRRGEFDYLVVLLHGGNENYPYPRPGLQDTARFLVEQGAAAVICQHSHCVGCMEEYRGAPIVYGQGNFLFDWPTHEAAFHQGLVVVLETDGTGPFRAKFVPYGQSRGHAGVRKLDDARATALLDGFWERSKHVVDPRMVEAQWDAYCERNHLGYLHQLHGGASVLRRLAGRLGLLRHLEPPDDRRRQLNVIRCESHREALLSVLAKEASRDERPAS